MRAGVLVLGCWALARAVWAADPNVELAKMEEARSCLACHGDRIIHAQRLSREVWTREVVKMIGWGAPVRDRELLIDYLAAQYGEGQPEPVPEQSGDGTKGDLRRPESAKPLPKR